MVDAGQERRGRVALDPLVGDEPVEQRANRVQLGRRRGAVEPLPLGQVPRAGTGPGPPRPGGTGGRDRAARRGPKTRRVICSCPRTWTSRPASSTARGANRRAAESSSGTTEPKRIGRIASTAAAMRRTVASWPRRRPRPPPGAASIRPTTRWNPRPARTSRRSRRSPRPGSPRGGSPTTRVEVEDAHVRRFRGASRSAAHRSAERRR